MLNPERIEEETAIQVKVSLREILDAVCNHYLVTPVEVCADRRDARALRPRHVFMYLAKALTTKSLPTIGRFIARDHSTVYSGAQKIAREIQKDETLQASIATIKARLGVAE